jgi:hypothetical protein
LFSPSSRFIAPELQFCLVSSSPSKVEQFSFELSSLSQRSALGSTTWPALGGWPVTLPLLSTFVLFLISARASGFFGRLACHLTPTFNLGALLFSVGCQWLLWEFDLSLHSAVALPTLSHLEFGAENLAPCLTLIFWVRFSVPLPTLLSVLKYAVYVLSFSAIRIINK